MITPEEWMDIHDLHRHGLSQREIARRSGHARNTVAKRLAQNTPQPYAKRERASCLDPYKPYLQARWQEYALSAIRLEEEIRAQGYTGSLNLVQRFLKTFKDQQGVRAKATVRFETPPGHQAQADWAYVGSVNSRKVYAFVMVLSFSRTLYVEFTQSMDIPTLIHAQQNAFCAYGGVPHSVLYDNMAQVRLPNGQLNPGFADFAAHYGFVIKTHQVRRPRTKGKVERMVEYLKDNFLNGRAFADLADLGVQGNDWCQKANQRHHATTGQRPCDLLAREKLTPLDPAQPYTPAQRHVRKVDVEGFVHLSGTRYSVPPQYVGQSVLLLPSECTMRVKAGETIVAQHPLGQPGECRADPEHVAAMWKQTLKHSSPPPLPHATFLPSETVASTPLSRYEELAS